MTKISKISSIILGVGLVLGIGAPSSSFAATDPGLGAASTFSIIAQTAITRTGTIANDVGLNSTGAGITALTDLMVGGTIYSSDGVAPSTATLDPSVQANLITANGNISGQGSTASIGPALDGLSLVPGVYDIGAGRLNGGVLTLDGAGVYILRASSDLISSGSINFINGATACDVFWQVNSLATINGSSFAGTIIAGTGVHFGPNVTLAGNALALGGDVTLKNTTISAPVCTAVVPSTSDIYNTITVIKNVINDNGGTSTFNDFLLYVGGTHVTSGQSVPFQAGTYAVTETGVSGYSATYSGDCNASGMILHGGASTRNHICFITNDDIGAPVAIPPVPPLIDIIKVPSPINLPNGPGLVTYSFALTNIGTVPVTDITVIDDSCNPLFISGDLNNNSALDLTETWRYSCSKTLTETYTNTVVATGWANGINVSDVADAIVTVGIPVVPPIIHVTKVPSPLILSAGGGTVTYTNKVTNPGIVALSNIYLADDKCEPVEYISGDINNDSKLDVTETWTYTCQTNLTTTTMNTITESGDANGLTARDFARATVVVNAAVPKLPNTGITSAKSGSYTGLVTVSLLTLATLFYLGRKQQLI